MSDLQQLSSKFISVHSLSAAKGHKYKCIICNSEGSFLCTQCRSCYCCREHLLLDDLACHALLCDRQAAMREIMKLPLATRTRPEISSKLRSLRDECRRVAYLESRRHVLEGNNELALPAAERSLSFAKEIYGNNSVELIPPLLALADVACLAGAQDAARGYASRARWLLLGKEAELRVEVETQLRPHIRHCHELINKLTGRQDAVLSARMSTDQSYNMQKLTRPFGASFSNNALRIPPVLQAYAEAEAETRVQKAEESSAGETYLTNCISDEIFRTKDGIRFAYLTARYWASETRLRSAENLYTEAIDSAALACYYSALATGSNSISTALQLYALAKLFVLSMSVGERCAVAVMEQAQKILRGTLIQYYAPYVIAVRQYTAENATEPDSRTLTKVMAEFHKADRNREEDERLAFRADIKESIQHMLFTTDYFEKAFGQKGATFIECVICIALCLEIVEDASRPEYVANAWELIRAVDPTSLHPILHRVFTLVFPY